MLVPLVGVYLHPLTHIPFPGGGNYLIRSEFDDVTDFDYVTLIAEMPNYQLVKVIRKFYETYCSFTFVHYLNKFPLWIAKIIVNVFKITVYSKLSILN